MKLLHVALVVLLCGVAAVTVGVVGADDVDSWATHEVVITDEGDVDRLITTIWLGGDEYDQWTGYAAAADEDDLSTFIGETFVDGSVGINDYTVTSVDEGDDWTEIEIVFADIDMVEIEEDGYVSTIVEDGTVRWEDEGVEAQEDLLFEEVTYDVLMPGSITDSNAYEEAGHIATYKLHEDHPGDLWALSEGGYYDNDGDDGDYDDADDGDADDSDGDYDDADDDVVPGFGLLAAVVGLLAVALLATRRHRADSE